MIYFSFLILDKTITNNMSAGDLKLLFQKCKTCKKTEFSAPIEINAVIESYDSLQQPPVIVLRSSDSRYRISCENSSEMDLSDFNDIEATFILYPIISRDHLGVSFKVIDFIAIDQGKKWAHYKNRYHRLSNIIQTNHSKTIDYYHKMPMPLRPLNIGIITIADRTSCENLKISLADKCVGKIYHINLDCVNAFEEILVCFEYLRKYRQIDIVCLFTNSTNQLGIYQLSDTDIMRYLLNRKNWKYPYLISIDPGHETEPPLSSRLANRSYSNISQFTDDIRDAQLACRKKIRDGIAVRISLLHQIVQAKKTRLANIQTRLASIGYTPHAQVLVNAKLTRLIDNLKYQLLYRKNIMATKMYSLMNSILTDKVYLGFIREIIKTTGAGIQKNDFLNLDNNTSLDKVTSHANPTTVNIQHNNDFDF
jgi:hypothetical protein